MNKNDVRRWVSHWSLPVLWSFLLALWAVRLTGHFPGFLDTVTYVFPEKWVNSALWADGTVPLWNPWIASGTPHLAQSQPACFYPPYLLWVFTGLTDWFFYLALAHTAFALVGFFLWARHKDVPWTLAWLGAGSFAFSALAVLYWGFPTHLATISWIPWVFLSCERALEKGGAGRWGVFALTVALQTLAGYAFFGFYTFVALAAYLAWGRKTTQGQWWAFVLASFAAAFLSAVQILPFVDYLTYAERLLGGAFTYQPREWWTLLWPDALGTPGLETHKGVPGHFIFNPYFGWVPLLGLFLALGRRFGETRFFAWGALVSFLVLAGLPWAPMVLEPLKAAPVFVFLGVSAGLFYWTKILGTLKDKKVWWVLGGVLWALDAFLVPFRMLPLVKDPYRKAENLAAVEILRSTTGEARLLTLRPKNQFYPPGIPGSLEASVDYRVKWMSPNTNSVWGVHSAGGYLSSSIDGFQNLHKYLWHGVENERLLDVAGVRTLMGIAPHHPKYIVQRTLADVPLTRNAGALPNAWRAATVREFPNRAAVFEALMDPSAFVEREVYTEDRPDGRAVLLPPPRRTLSGDASDPYGWWERVLSKWGRLWGGGDTVSPVRLSACQAEMTADYRERGWMVWSESYAPGWRAWVDGKPKDIFRADGLWMAVPVKGTGLHHVVFKYEPTAFRVGLFMTMASWMALLAWGCVWARRFKGFWPFRR